MGDGFVQKLRDLFKLNIIEDTDLEVFCKKNYRLIPNIAYKNKRKVAGLSYSLFLNELVRPDAFTIGNLKNKLLLTGNRVSRIKNVGNTVAKVLTWTDDKNLDSSGDYYQDVSETLSTKKGDCEDHSYVMQSALPDDLGIAYGFFRTTGHAFNAAVIEGELWVVDTVGDAVVLIPYKRQTDYKIHFIITKRFTFELKGGVRFGDIAGYDS